MRRQLVDHFWIVVAAAVISFTNLGGAALWDEDEPLYASCAREMLERDDWVVPYYNGEMFPDKPPLMFWTMMLGFKLFGINELGARFFSAVFAVATAVATYHLGRRLFCQRVGFWAGLIVPSSIVFTVSARAATVDSALTLVITLAMLALVSTGIAQRGKSDKSTRPHPSVRPWFVPVRWFSWMLFWVCLGVAVLAKGPVGLLLPAASAGLFLMIMNYLSRSEDTEAWGSRKDDAARDMDSSAVRPHPSPRPEAEGASGGRRWFGWLVVLARVWSPSNFLRSLWQMRPLTGIVIAVAIAGPWFAWVAVRDPEMLRVFFGKFNWRPFTEPILGHSGPFWYYVPAILIGFFPWSAFLGQSLVRLVGRIRARDTWTAGHILVACWIGVFLVFWSICRTKLPHYMLPTYPALALVMACFVHGITTEPARANRRWLRLDLSWPVLAGIGIIVAFPVAAAILVPGEEWLGLVGLILVFGGSTAWYLVGRLRIERAMIVFTAMSVAWVTAIFGFAALRIDRYQFSKPLAAEIDEDRSGDRQIAGFRFIRESLVFYAGQPITYCRKVEELDRFLGDSPRPYVITVDEHVADLEEHFPDQFREIARRPRFLHPGEVIVLARQPGSNIAHTADRMTPRRR